MTESELSSQEPDTPHRGLNVQDFPRTNLWWTVRQAISLLPRSKR